MVQFYFLTELFLFASAGLLLAGKYGMRLLFLINLRDLFFQKKAVRRIFYLCGLLCAVIGCLSPVEPGPAVLGDLIPVLTIVINLLCLIFKFSREKLDFDVTDNRNSVLGTFTLTVALLHFVFPAFVLL